MHQRIVAAVFAAGLIGIAASHPPDARALEVLPGAGQDAGQQRAQARPKRARNTVIRPPARITVTPRNPLAPRYGVLRQSINYPAPIEIHAPGPGFVRECTSWLAQEFRPSGPVLVPRKRCWWQRG